MINILVVDDHPRVRRGIKEILNEERDIGMLGEAQDAGGALKLIRTQRWHLVLLDLSLPDRNGLELLRDVKREYPALPILVVSMYPEDQCAERSLRAGASGYLSKTRVPLELVAAVHTVLGGGTYVSGTPAQATMPARAAVTTDAG